MTFKKTKVCKAALAAIGGAVMLTSLPTMVQAQERVEVTGSRIKRVDAEGALPVTTIGRAEIEASGAVTVAEFMRTIPFAAAGNFRPQSGSSAQSFASIDLRGLGAERTLVLIDGRRAAKGPMVGDSVDLNIIPMAMIERVEVLTDGASAIYGSDAIAGVVNFITRKDFQGVEAMVGGGWPSTDGGDRQEASAVFGVQGEKGRMFGGASMTSRDIIFTRNMPWPDTRTSAYGNNYQAIDPATGGPTGGLLKVPDACGDPLFVETETQCRYSFPAIAADEAQVKTQAVFVNGEYEIAAGWTAYGSASVSTVTSFGRYAPTPGNLVLDASSPNNPFGEDIYLWHRFAAAGPRDTNTDNNYYSYNIGARALVFDKVDVDFGFLRNDSRYTELGRNYIVRDLARQAFNDGSYNLRQPSQTPQEVLDGIKATISRDARFRDNQYYANATFDAFQMGGGSAMVNVGAEYRQELFFDNYDSLSEGGAIEGSAGNSSGGDRDVTALFGEMLLPVTRDIEVNLALRYEDYSDYGSDFAPKIGGKWRPMEGLALRASYGQGFRAPSLPILTQKTTFSAESVIDPRSCAVLGTPGADCTSEDVQVNTYFQANPALDSEKSDQWSIGGVWDATPWLSLKADYWNIKVKDTIVEIGAQDIVDRDNGTDPRPIPAGLGVIRGTDGVISRINAGYANEGTLKTDGIDIDIAATWSLQDYGRFRHNLRWTHTFSYEQGGFDFAGSIGYPEDRATLLNAWTMGAFTAYWNINYIGRNEFSPNSATDTRSVGSYVTNDFQLDWRTPIKGGGLTVGVLNAFDKLPSLVTYEGRPFNFYLYDAYGRTWYLRYTQQF